MSTFNIRKLLVLPETLEANTLYMIADADVPNEFILYVSNNDGSAARQLPKGMKAADVIEQAGTAPSLTDTTAAFWFDSVKGTLFVRYKDSNDQEQWVEANPSAVVPQFGGSGDLFGTASTMARTDHAHDSIVAKCEW